MSDHPNRSPIRISHDVLATGAIAVLLKESVERTVTTQGRDDLEHVRAEGRSEGLSWALGILVQRDATELRAEVLAGILEERARERTAIDAIHDQLRSDR